MIFLQPCLPSLFLTKLCLTNVFHLFFTEHLITNIYIQNRLITRCSSALLRSLVSEFCAFTVTEITQVKKSLKNVCMFWQAVSTQ